MNSMIAIHDIGSIVSDISHLQLQAKFPSPSQVHLGTEAALYINHDRVVVQDLHLDGAMVVEGAKDAFITIDGLRIAHDQGWEWEALREGVSAKEDEQIR